MRVILLLSIYLNSELSFSYSYKKNRKNQMVNLVMKSYKYPVKSGLSAALSLQGHIRALQFRYQTESSWSVLILVLFLLSNIHGHCVLQWRESVLKYIVQVNSKASSQYISTRRMLSMAFLNVLIKTAQMVFIIHSWPSQLRSPIICKTEILSWCCSRSKLLSLIYHKDFHLEIITLSAL